MKMPTTEVDYILYNAQAQGRARPKTKDLKDSGSDRPLARYLRRFLNVMNDPWIMKDALERRSRSHLLRSTSTFLEHLAIFAQAAAHRLIAREQLRAATMRSGRLTQAIAGNNDEVGRTADPACMLRTWTEDTTMTEDKQCLRRVQRDTTEGRCLEEGCGKNMLDVCCDLTPYETSRWLELKSDRENVTRSGIARTQRQSEYIETVTMLLWSVARTCCSTRCLQSLSSTRWLRYGVGAHEARCVSRHLTRHSLSAHS